MTSSELAWTSGLTVFVEVNPCYRREYTQMQLQHQRDALSFNPSAMPVDTTLRRRPVPPHLPGSGGAGRRKWIGRPPSPLSAGHSHFVAAISPSHSVATQKADHLALHADTIRPENSRFIGRIRRLERDRRAPFAKPFESGFLFVDQGDDDVAGFRRLLPADNDGVVFENAGLDHRVATHLE